MKGVWSREWEGLICAGNGDLQEVPRPLLLAEYSEGSIMNP